MRKSADYAFKEIVAAALKGPEIITRNSVVRRVRNFMYSFTSTPLVSARRTSWKNAIREMEWFLSGSNRIADLHPSVHSWWEPWANEDGLVPANYSAQFRGFHGYEDYIDQIHYLVEGIKHHPFSRRNVITTWHTQEMADPETPITNCHGTVIQCFVDPDRSLHLTMYQRSADIILGLPHNWIQYWAFLLWLAEVTGTTAGSFTWVGGDCHLYQEHYGMAQKILAAGFAPPIELVYNPTSDRFQAADFSLDKPYEPEITERVKMIV